MRRALHNFRDWLEETHSTGFELRRHFFRRFFDSDLVSTPGQWRVVAIGALAILLSSSIIFAQAYYHKYRVLAELDSPEPFRLASIADALFLVTLSMFVIGLFTTLQWPLLFPGLRDYLALAALPVRMRDVFVAKFTALIAFAGAFVVATTLPPSLFLPAMMAGQYAIPSTVQIPATFVSCSLAALFILFLLVSVQGVLLNILPAGQFARVSLAVQGTLLLVLLCGLPLVFSIPNLQNSMNQRPDWLVWVPPAWFLGLHQVMAGNHEPFANRLAQISLTGVAAAIVAAVVTYLWSYRRHKVRLLESPAAPPKMERRSWLAEHASILIPDSSKLAVFAFIAKTLARSRQHRLVLTGFAAIAAALIFDSFVTLSLDTSVHTFAARTLALREAAISAPLALSLFVLAGFRYLFRLPVELRANWVFRVNELGNRRTFLAAARQFLICFAVAPVSLLTLPLEMRVLGPGIGIVAAILCLLPPFTLMELLLIHFEKIPFTSGYLPGRRPLIETLVIYGIAVIFYVSILSTIVNWCLKSPPATLILFAILLGAWWLARRARREDWEFGKLEFEELPEPAVLTLSIQRD
ncbi:MAG TPA: hypothetical protein VNH83_30705 [Bryobacteraceae bacterium]|nr:hypothetical protein [Bryobacteraceae bacterium]